MLQTSMNFLRRTLVQPNRFHFGRISDMFTEKTSKKQHEQFKQQMQYLANKPQFDLKDFKLRVEDELSKVKNNIQGKFKKESQAQEKQLEIEKNITNCMFEEELLLKSEIKGQEKEDIALITQQPLQKVRGVLQKFNHYKTMHKVLRSLKENNEPLPETMEELQSLIQQSGLQHHGKKAKYYKYREHSRRMQVRSAKKDLAEKGMRW